MPTKKQLLFIETIEEELGITFKGKTKREVSDFIGAHKKSLPDNDWAIIKGY